MGDREEVERLIREACAQGRWREATTTLIESYGPEISAYLRAMSNRDRADDAFGDFALDLWRALPGFQWRCSARGFAFALARSALARLRVREQRSSRRDRTYARESWLGELVARTRTPTPLHQRSEVKGALQSLREELNEDERTLLILRVDRGLSWRDLAVVLAGSDEPDVERTAARLRKRYQLLKVRLRKRLESEGLLDGR